MSRSSALVKILLSAILPVVILSAATFFSYTTLVTSEKPTPLSVEPTPKVLPDSSNIPNIAHAPTSTEPTPESFASLHQYITIIDSCGPDYTGDCVRARSGPGTNYPVYASLRTGMVLKVSDIVFGEDGSRWYKIAFDEWLRYPDRLLGDWYVSAAYGSSLYDIGDRTMSSPEFSTTSQKRIVVDRGDQTLTASEGTDEIMSFKISTGLELTPTPRGTFQIFKMTPSRYMQGPLPYLADQQVYDLPGVPWNLYFTKEGAVIHGAYWHESFGSPYSHGCVNLSPSDAKQLYDWSELGTEVVVRD